MKVLVSAYACDPSRGGEFSNGWSYAYNAIHGISIWCITTSEGKEAITQRLASEPIERLQICYVDIPPWVQWIKDRFTTYGVYFHYWYFQQYARRLALELDSTHQFDVVHHATYGSLQMGTFVWRLDKPFLFGPVGGGQTAPKKFKRYFSKWWHMETVRGIVSRLMLDVVGSPVRALKKSGLTLVVNEDTFHMAKKYGAKRIEYAPCSLLPDDLFPSSVPERKRDSSLRLLWVGRLLARKGLRLVLEAVATLEDTLPITLTVIGDGPQQHDLAQWIDELGIQKKITCMGKLPFSKVQEAYREHDVFVYCSLRESLGSQIFESMSYGMPLIILNHHGAKTFVPDDAAWKIEVTEPQKTVADIGHAIKLFFYNPDYRRKLGECAYEASRNFVWSKRISIINQYYAQLANTTVPTCSSN